MRYRLNTVTEHQILESTGFANIYRVTVYGVNEAYHSSIERGQHRFAYTDADAQAICDWLNYRSAGDGYKTGRRLNEWFDADRIHLRIRLGSTFVAGRRISEWPSGGMYPHRESYSLADWVYVNTELRSI